MPKPTLTTEVFRRRLLSIDPSLKTQPLDFESTQGTKGTMQGENVGLIKPSPYAVDQKTRDVMSHKMISMMGSLESKQNDFGPSLDALLSLRFSENRADNQIDKRLSEIHAKAKNDLESMDEKVRAERISRLGREPKGPKQKPELGNYIDKSAINDLDRPLFKGDILLDDFFYRKHRAFDKAKEEINESIDNTFDKRLELNTQYFVNNELKDPSDRRERIKRVTRVVLAKPNEVRNRSGQPPPFPTGVRHKHDIQTVSEFNMAVNRSHFHNHNRDREIMLDPDEDPPTQVWAVSMKNDELSHQMKLKEQERFDRVFRDVFKPNFDRVVELENKRKRFFEQQDFINPHVTRLNPQYNRGTYIVARHKDTGEEMYFQTKNVNNAVFSTRNPFGDIYSIYATDKKGEYEIRLGGIPVSPVYEEEKNEIIKDLREYQQRSGTLKKIWKHFSVSPFPTLLHKYESVKGDRFKNEKK